MSTCPSTVSKVSVRSADHKLLAPHFWTEQVFSVQLSAEMLVGLRMLVSTLHSPVSTWLRAVREMTPHFPHDYREDSARHCGCE